MRKFVSKLTFFILIGCIPLAILSLGYVINDPFKVIHQYDDYSNSKVILNRDYVSTQMFIKNNPKYKYNSFIFGSSRTIAYNPKEWTVHLPSGSNPFVFDASGESIWGIATKLAYLDSLNAPINNALIILCRDCSFSYRENPESHLSIHDPRVVGSGRILYQCTFLKAYFAPEFLLRYYTYLTTHKYSGWMKGYLENRQIIYDTITNKLSIIDQEMQIQNNPKKILFRKGAVVLFSSIY